MVAIATINRKGGCGKTTLATHLAVDFARRLQRVMLVDVDFQQSTVRWLKRRRTQVDLFEFSHACTDTSSLQRTPAGVCHSVIDTPGSIRGYELAKLLLFSDVVLIPVCDSMFDFDGSADCIAEMRRHPKVSKGRVELAVVGMRIKPGSAGDQRAREWAARMAVPYLGCIRSSGLYEQSAAKGLTVFDLASGEAGKAELADWKLVVAQLDELINLQSSHEAEAGKWRARAHGAGDSGFSESTFGSSTFGPSAFGTAMRVQEQVSLVSRSPGSQRPAAGHSLISRVLRSIPSWSSRDRTQPLV